MGRTHQGRLLASTPLPLPTRATHGHGRGAMGRMSRGSRAEGRPGEAGVPAATALCTSSQGRARPEGPACRSTPRSHRLAPARSWAVENASCRALLTTLPQWFVLFLLCSTGPGLPGQGRRGDTVLLLAGCVGCPDSAVTYAFAFHISDI